MKFCRGRLFDHVHLVVANLESSRRFYGAAIGSLGLPIQIVDGPGFFYADELFVVQGAEGRSGVLECRKEDRGGVNVNALGDMPSVLIEPFFGSNNLSCLSWTSDSGQSALVNAIIHALEFSIGTRRIV